MQISRHWRMNAQRYRLEGVRIPQNTSAMQTRVSAEEPRELVREAARQPSTARMSVSAAR